MYNKLSNYNYVVSSSESTDLFISLQNGNLRDGSH